MVIDVIFINYVIWVLISLFFDKCSVWLIFWWGFILICVIYYMFVINSKVVFSYIFVSLFFVIEIVYWICFRVKYVILLSFWEWVCFIWVGK